MFQMLQKVGQFSGLPIEDLRLHLRVFLDVCDSLRQQGVPEDALKLKLFPYSLAWLNALPSGTVASWNELCQRFLLRYNPSNMNAKLRNDITSFRQSEDDTLYEA
ncbi:protein FAR1-RELATED SEQUENCE 5-like [Gossypium australe]|uniref:Protein FAR1-RELATED SEQUENCE 5-like n=1 Tax=Gossypium australe TaxID=47621 RepID=A0A5B6WRM3_9ROSI|nr:protein FAR1-RELATED SEQUENCE 5-like [Gossypium australe]